MAGIRDCTCWAYRIRDKSEALIDALNYNLSALELHKAFIQDFVASGGELESYVLRFTHDV